MATTAEPTYTTDVRVPEVRLVELGPLSTEEQALHYLVAETADLISVEVTRHASGPGEYKLTLNNWDPRQHRHKYNDFAVLTFGKRLRIDMRYVGERYFDIRAPQAWNSAWVPMIAGPITDMQFSFGSEGSRVSISGEDDLRPLKDKSEKRIPYKDNELDIIVSTLRECGYPLDVHVEVTEQLKFIIDRSQQNRINEAHEKGQSYLEYIQKFVDRYDLELFLAFDEPDDAVKSKKQLLRLVASRANRGPIDQLIVLRHGHELIDFSPAIKVADQFTSARVRGRNRFRDEPEGVDGKAGADVVKEEVDRYREDGDPELVPAPDVRRRFFPGNNPSDDRQKTNLDEYRAEAAARAKLLRKARELMVVQATTIGLPRLRPGRYVRIEGISDPFNGLYYVTTTTHSWGSDGAKTRFTAQRAGMPLPTATTGAAA